MTYIDQKLFAYIEHKTSMTSDISKRYQNSLILIGDEHQLYNPLTNTYVGIEYSSYLNTIDFINKRSKEIYIDSGKDSSSNTYYIPIINNSNYDRFYNAYVTSKVGIKPSEGAFVGNLIGTADNAKMSDYATFSSLSDQNYKNLIINDNSHQAENAYLMLSNTKTNNAYSYSYVNSLLYYNKTEKSLYSTYFNGILNGNASSANYAITSEKTLYTKIYSTTDNQSYYITFVNGNDEYGISYISSNLQYNPYTNTLYTRKLNIYGGRSYFYGGVAFEDPIYINDTLNVNDQASFNGSATFHHPVHMDNTLYVSKIEVMGGESTFNGGVHFNGTVEIEDTLRINDKSIFSGSATFNNKVNINSTLFTNDINTTNIHISNFLHLGNGFEYNVEPKNYPIATILYTSDYNDHSNYVRKITFSDFCIRLKDSINLNDRYLPLGGGIMTGTIKRYYSDNTDRPMISLTSNNANAYLWNISHGNVAVDNSINSGFALQYNGAGSGNYNNLILYADNNTTNAPIKAITINQDGTLWVGTASTHLNSYINNSKILTEANIQAILPINGNQIAVKINSYTSPYITVPFATKSNESVNTSYTKIYSTTDNKSYYITFVNGNDEYKASYVSSNLKVNPYTNTTYSLYFEGQLEPSLQWGEI